MKRKCGVTGRKLKQKMNSNFRRLQSQVSTPDSDEGDLDSQLSVKPQAAS